jgi:hypothetical protein
MSLLLTRSSMEPEGSIIQVRTSLIGLLDGKLRFCSREPNRNVVAVGEARLWHYAESAKSE